MMTVESFDPLHQTTFVGATTIKVFGLAYNIMPKKIVRLKALARVSKIFTGRGEKFYFCVDHRNVGLGGLSVKLYP
ncbi:hypothetical protein, partial [Salmonella sp. s51228]|uniref:hypothetical protein n=1 Tax=Salmonella sp. s51228 TaxID=3159652 RepID=UPI00397FBCEC